MTHGCHWAEAIVVIMMVGVDESRRFKEPSFEIERGLFYRKVVKADAETPGHIRCTWKTY